MNFIKRAILSVGKRKTKNLIMVVLMAVVAVFILSGYALKTAIGKTQESIQSHIGANATLEFDGQKAIEAFQKNNPGQSGGIKGENIPISTAEKIAENEHVTGYNFYQTSGAVADSFKLLYDEATQKTIQDMMRSYGKNYEAPNLQLTGALDSSLLGTFTSGQYTLLKGRHITKEDAGKKLVLIEETQAQRNNLDLGDTISLHWNKDPSKVMTLTIAGIFRAPAAEGIMANYASMNPVNFLIVSYADLGVLDAALATDVETVTYYLDSPDSIQAFKQFAAEHVDMNVFMLTADEEAYQGITGPLENVSSLTTGLTVALIISACLILGLVILISLRNRKREFGVLLALGECKHKIIGQILIETVIPMCIALALAMPLSNVAAKTIGTQLLRNEINQIQTQTNGGTTFTTPGMQSGDKVLDDKAIENIDISASAADYVNFGIIYGAIVLLAAALPLVSILRLHPRSILLKQG